MNRPFFMKRLIGVLFLSLFLTQGIFTVRADNTSEFYGKLVNMPSDALYEKGVTYHREGVNLDSALVCFTILGNRANASKESNEHVLCIKAFAEMAYIWYFHYYDYSKAIENMEKARDLMEKWGENVSLVPLYYGLMYGSIGTQSSDPKTSKTALEYLQKAFHSAVDNKEYHTVNVAFSNMLSNAYSLGMTDSISRELEIFKKIATDSPDPNEKFYTLFNLHMHDGLKALSLKKHDDAQASFDKMLAKLPDTPQYSRYHCGAWEFKGLVHQDAGRYADAESAYKTALKFAEDNSLLDAKVEIYRDLADLYKIMGRNDEHIQYENNYLSIKDSLLSFQQVKAIDEVRFLGELHKVEDKLHETDMKSARIMRILIICGILLVSALGAIWFAVWFIRKLRRINRALYAKNEEVFKAQEEERRLRTRYEGEVAELKRRLEDCPEAAPAKAPVAETSVKYSGSNLSEEAKQVIADKIRNVMETSQEIYSTEFSAERLAELVGERYKNVSQVINEIWGVNFNILLNNFRIREACKRITDEKNYRHFTIEALAETVGFKSRSTFVSQFKRVTGLTPTQYIAESRKG